MSNINLRRLPEPIEDEDMMDVDEYETEDLNFNHCALMTLNPVQPKAAKRLESNPKYV